MPAQRRCPICKKPFTPRRADARYCSGTCRQRAHRLRRRIWYGDAIGNVWIDGRWVGRISPPPGGRNERGRPHGGGPGGWEGTGSDAVGLEDRFPSHRVTARLPDDWNWQEFWMLRRVADDLDWLAGGDGSVLGERVAADSPVAAELRGAAEYLRRRARAAMGRRMDLSEARAEEVRRSVLGVP